MRFLSIYFHIQDMTGRQDYHCPGSYLKTASGPCENLVSRCRGDPLGDSRRGPAVKVHSSTLGGFTVRKHLDAKRPEHRQERDVCFCPIDTLTTVQTPGSKQWASREPYIGLFQTATAYCKPRCRLKAFGRHC